jgi:hypothetical protein
MDQGGSEAYGSHGVVQQVTRVVVPLEKRVEHERHVARPVEHRYVERVERIPTDEPVAIMRHDGGHESVAGNSLR